MDGHIDKTLPWKELTWWEQRNVEADQLAKAYRRQLEEQANLPPALNARFFTESSALFINGIKQQALSKVRLMELVALPRLRKRWSDRQTITRNVEEEVDWATVAKAMKGLRPGLQRWITKHSEGMCGVGRWLRRWKWSTHDKCPICGVPDETAHHVPRCPDTRAAKAWAEQIDVLAAWLSSHKTDPELSRIILHFLDRIRSPTARVIHVSQPYRAVLDSQLIIGPQGLLEGRLSRLFRPLQDQFYHRTGSSRSSTLWASRLSRALIGVGYGMWQHRNSVQHLDQSVDNKTLSAQVNEGILAQFAAGTDDLPIHLHSIIRAGPVPILEQSLLDRQEWLTMLRLERANRERTLTPQRRLIRSFLCSHNL